MVLIAMGYDAGELDLSAHPFTTSFHPTDVRVTTRVHEHDLQSCPVQFVSMEADMGVRPGLTPATSHAAW